MTATTEAATAMAQPYLRKVRFEEVDPAGVVFFAHLVRYAHEAMECFFDPLDGGYVALVTKRHVGFPTVRLEVDFVAPVRYGDTLRIDTSVGRVGERSAELNYLMQRQRDGVVCVRLRHVVVISDLVCMKSCDMPADVRAHLLSHMTAA